MIHPILGGFFGGWEIILILAMVLAFGIAVVVGVVLLAIRSNQKPPAAQSFSTASPPVAVPPRDLEQELRTLAKLKNERLITEDDFNQKKKAILGI